MDVVIIKCGIRAEPKGETKDIEKERKEKTAMLT